MILCSMDWVLAVCGLVTAIDDTSNISNDVEIYNEAKNALAAILRC